MSTPTTLTASQVTTAIETIRKSYAAIRRINGGEGVTRATTKALDRHNSRILNSESDLLNGGYRKLVGNLTQEHVLQSRLTEAKHGVQQPGVPVRPELQERLRAERAAIREVQRNLPQDVVETRLATDEEARAWAATLPTLEQVQADEQAKNVAAVTGSVSGYYEDGEGNRGAWFRYAEEGIETDERGVRFVAVGLTVDDLVRGWALCNSCGIAWDDQHGTSVTPTPAGRCPFEYDHEVVDDDHAEEIEALHASEWNAEQDAKDIDAANADDDTAARVYGFAYLRARDLPTFRAYLYSATTVLATREGVDRYGQEIALVVTSTRGRDSDQARYLQQYQCDRLASGLLNLTIGYHTQEEAQRVVDGRARDNGFIAA